MASSSRAVLLVLFVSFLVASAFSREVFFGYFDSDDTSPAETADHVNMAMIGADGPSSARDFISQRILKQMQLAKDSGTPYVCVALTHILYTFNGRKATYNTDPVTVPLLVAFFDQMRDLNLTHMVKCFYPIDEPELYGVSVPLLYQANGAVRAVAVSYLHLANASLGVIYGDKRNYPAIENYDWVGFDNYGAKEGIFNGLYQDLVSRLKPNQKTIIVPGGAQPWNQDPTRFVQQALTDTRVAWLTPFLWLSPYEGGRYKGIKDNGMAPAYRNAGKQIIAANSK